MVANPVSRGSGSTIELPSGKFVDIDNPNISGITSADDAETLISELQVKIISIEQQIENAKALLHTGHGRSDPQWLASARTALRWAKLHRHEAQNHWGRLRRDQRAREASLRDHKFGQAFISAAKARLTGDQFQELVAFARKAIGESE